MMNQLMVQNQELNRKGIEISTLKFELNYDKEVPKRMKKHSETMKYFEDLIRSPRGINDMTGLGYNSINEKGESSKSGE